MRSRRSLIAVILVLALNGCIKVGPDFSPPVAPVKREWRDNGEKIVIDEKRVCYWWRLFDDDTLNTLIEKAYRQNLPLKIAAFRIMEARAVLAIARGEFFPQTQGASGSALRSGLSKNQPNTGPFPDLYFKDYQLAFQAAWELDFWGKFRRAIDAERANLLASYATYDDILVLLLSDVAATYIKIRTIEERIKITLDNIKIQQRSVEISRAQYEGGFVSELDLQQATTLLKDTESVLPVLEKDLAQAENALSVLLGTPPGDLRELLRYPGKIPDYPEEIAVNLPENLLQRRPDIREAFHLAAAQSERIGIAFAEFFPAISLNGVIALRSSGNSYANVSGQSGNLLDRTSLTFNYGSGLFWPLLNYGRIAGRVRAEKALYCHRLMDYRDRVLRAYQEVEDGIVAYSKAMEQSAYLRDSVKAAKRSFELSNAQYVEGAVDYIRVLNSLETLLAEEDKLVVARSSIALSLIATYKALGGGWEIRECDYLN